MKKTNFAKKLISLLFVGVLSSNISMIASAQDFYSAKAVDFSIVKDNMTQNQNSIYPVVVINGKTYVCLTDMCDIAGLKYYWDEDSKTIYLEDTNSYVRYDPYAPYAPAVEYILGIEPEYVTYTRDQYQRKIIIYNDTSNEFKLGRKYAEALTTNGFRILTFQDNVMVFSDDNNNVIGILFDYSDTTFSVIYYGKNYDGSL